MLSGPHDTTREPAPGRRARGWLASLAALTVALVHGASGCSSGATEPRPAPRLVLLYAPCSVATGFLSPYDASVTYTPRLQEFADDALVFERHNTEAGQSGTDFAALFCGTQAYKHGVYCHPKQLSPDLYQISEAYARAGYDTFFWSGHGMATWPLGYGQGVPPEQAYPKGETLESFTATGPAFHAILDRLASDPGYKAFVQVNFTITHSPYYKGMTEKMLNRFAAKYPGEIEGVTDQDLRRWVEFLDGDGEKNRLELQWNWREASERFGLTPDDLAQLDAVQHLTYKVKINQLDTVFGRVLDSIRERGLFDDSLIAFTADHGEIFFRDNADFVWAHGSQLAPEVLQVPLILRGPKQGARVGRYAGVTRSIDVFPTMAALSGIFVPPSEPVDGVSLARAVRSEEPPPALLAYSHTTTIEGPHVDVHRNDPLFRTFNPRPDPELLWVRVRDGDVVYKHRNLDGTTWVHQVFDLGVDPGERHDVFDPDDPMHREMVEKLARYKALLVEGYDESDRSLSGADELQTLQDLGYAGQDG